MSGNLQGRVQLSYDVANNLAELAIEGASPRVQFRSTNRDGGLIRRRPGLFIEVGHAMFVSEDIVQRLASSPRCLSEDIEAAFMASS